MSAVSSRLSARVVACGPDDGETVADLVPGCREVRVCGLAGVEAEVARRLTDLGFTPGALVAVTRRAPFGGPLLVRVADYEVALRRGEAQAIRVTPALAAESCPVAEPGRATDVSPDVDPNHASGPETVEKLVQR